MGRGGLEFGQDAGLVRRVQKEDVVGQPERGADLCMPGGPGPGGPLRREAGLGHDIGQAERTTDRRPDQVRRLVEKMIGEPEVGRFALHYPGEPAGVFGGQPLDALKAFPVRRLRHVAAHPRGDRCVVAFHRHCPQEQARDCAVAGRPRRIGRFHRRVKGYLHGHAISCPAKRPVKRSWSARTVTAASKPAHTRSLPLAP